MQSRPAVTRTPCTEEASKLERIHSDARRQGNTGGLRETTACWSQDYTKCRRNASIIHQQSKRRAAAMHPVVSAGQRCCCTYNVSVLIFAVLCAHGAFALSPTSEEPSSVRLPPTTY